MKKYFFAILITIAAASALAWHRTRTISYSPSLPPSPTSQVAATEASEQPDQSPAQTPETSPAPATSTTTGASPMVHTQVPNATLIVDGTSYKISIPKEESALDAMNEAAAAAVFTYSGREYPGMGFFVDTINGRRNGNGYYWILYINGKTSDLGVSAASVLPGDTIEWKYEKGY